MRGNEKPRVLVFIVAYNAEKTVAEVLFRIPTSLSDNYEVHVLVIDDSSADETFARSHSILRRGDLPFTLTVLVNPINQGYGGNQKLGYRYAIENHFDFVDSAAVAATRRKVASARPRRCVSSARQERNAPMRRAATCGFFGSSSITTSATKS